MRPLPTLGGNNAFGIGVGNDRRQLVGLAENNTHDTSCVPPQVLDWEAVEWGPRYGQIHELPPLRGDTIGAASAINDKGDVVGTSGTCAPPTVPAGNFRHALLWHDRSAIDLGSLGGTMNNFVTGINNRGQVVGVSDLLGETNFHAFLWQHGAMTDLGTFRGDVSSVPFSINDRGQVVGQSCDANGNCRAFLWQNGTMTNLNSIAHVTSPGSFFLPLAEGINSQGEIVGMAVDQSTGNTPGFSAVPCDDLPADNPGCASGQNTISSRGAMALWSVPASDCFTAESASASSGRGALDCTDCRSFPAAERWRRPACWARGSWLKRRLGRRA